MKPEDFLNWANISRYCSGSRTTIRKNKIPMKHLPFIKDLTRAMKKVMDNYPKN